MVVLHALKKDFNFVSDLQIFFRLGELVEVDQALGFKADVDGDQTFGQPQHFADDDFAFLEVLEALFKIGLHFLMCGFFFR